MTELSAVDKLVETEAKTNGDGTVRVTIEDWRVTESGEHVYVEFETPTGEVRENRLPFPQPGGDLEDYLFYRLLRDAGLEMRNAELLSGHEVNARVEGNQWLLHVPRQTTVRDVFRNRTSNVKNWWEETDVISLTLSMLWTGLVLMFLVLGILVVL